MHITKTLIFALAIICASTAWAATQQNSLAPKSLITKLDPKKTEITPSELPGNIKDVIMEGKYAKWNIAKVYKITYKSDTGKVEYEVHFVNEKKDKEILVYDASGSIIED